ncbi:unnamed protein product, partial [Coccothraustes coccothraustes]
PASHIPSTMSQVLSSGSWEKTWVFDRDNCSSPSSHPCFDAGSVMASSPFPEGCPPLPTAPDRVALLLPGRASPAPVTPSPQLLPAGAGQGQGQ